MIRENHFPSAQEALEIIKKSGFQDRFEQLETNWQQELERVGAQLGITKSDTPGQQLAETTQASFHKTPSGKLIIGLAGPGAAGKGTIGGRLLDELGFAKVINTTTRQPREGEINGVHYNFVDLNTFRAKQTAGDFASSLERPGRGWYGTEKSEISQKLTNSEAGCLFEENPENIIKILRSIDQPQADKVLIYILPPEPVVLNSARRLIYRLSQEADSTKRQLTTEVFESTLGQRQIDEFSKIDLLANQSDIQLLVIINDQLDETVNKLRQLLQ